jgi:hypothetical protein
VSSNQGEPEGSVQGIRWEIVLVVGVIVLACAILACTLGVAGLLFARRGQTLVATSPTFTAPTRLATVPVPTQTPIPPPTATPVPTVRPSATSTATAVPEPTRTARATSTPTDLPARPSATPTAVVCDDLAALGQIALAPGQAFICTIDQGQLTEELDSRPENPCSSTDVTFGADGQIHVTCRIGLTLQAAAVVEVNDCRMNLRIVSSTFGFGQLIQGLIDENQELVPYDQICVDDAEVGQGEITVRGHRR